MERLFLVRMLAWESLKLKLSYPLNEVQVVINQLCRVKSVQLVNVGCKRKRGCKEFCVNDFTVIV